MPSVGEASTRAYLVVFEKGEKNWSAYAPDVPGCISTGKTVVQTLANLREALAFHFEGMVEDGDPIPDPQTLIDYVDVKLPARKKQTA